MTTRVYVPDGDVGPEPVALTKGRPALTGLRIGVLDNGKPNAGILLTRVAEQLAARSGACLGLVTKKGPGGNAATPCTPAVFERLTHECDVVLTGSADCGSCTSWSVHDTIQLERAGVPAVVATTTHFVDLTRRVATGFGLPDARIAVFPHPLGGTDDATIRAWADAAVPEILALLTRS
ncbi:MAG: UGSC family (seleno)protein [Acidimicrobiia bacterium]